MILLQEANQQRQAPSDGLLRSAMAPKKSLDGSVPFKRTHTTSFEVSYWIVLRCSRKQAARA